MILETFLYDRESKKWSVRALPVLDGDRTLVLAFGAPELLDDPGPLDELCRAYPRSHLIGCSSAGEIAGATVRDGTLSVAVARFDKTALATASVEVAHASESFAAGQALARKLDRPGLRAVLLLSEGLGVNGSQLLRGVNVVLPDSVVVTGGLSGDGTRFGRTWVCCGSSVRSGIVAAVGLYGEHIVVQHGSKGGWDKFGPERVVTRSEGNVLYEIDGRPALALYKEYLGDKASELPASALLFPLSMRVSEHDTKSLVRTVLSVDHEKQSMTFAGDVPRGHLVQLMKANFERLIDGASLAAKAASETATPAGESALAIAISCVGRRIVLGDRAEEEVEAVLDVLPKGTRVTGFYSYGEISPYATGHCDLHNQTMTLTVLSESPTPIAKRVAGRPRPAPKESPAVAARLVAQPAGGMAEFEELEVASDSTFNPQSPPSGRSPGLRLETFSFARETGRWSVRVLPGLDSERTLVLVFGATEFLDDPGAIRELRRAYPRSHMIGCSSAGEIADTAVRDGTLSVAVTRFDKTALHTAWVDVPDASASRAAGQALARKLDQPGLRAVLVLSEGLSVNGSQLVRGLNDVLPESVVVTGGLSGDGTRFGRTWVCIGDAVRSGIVAAVGFYGDHVVVQHGSKGGWDKFGPERVVTRSEGNVLYEIDGRPALALYKEYLGDKVSALPASALLFPLSMRASPQDDKSLVRTVLSVDHEKQSMTFAGDVPKGHLVQLMKADFDRLIGGASLAAKSAMDLAAPAHGAALAVAISCVGRRIVLGDRTEEEVEAVLDVLPKGTRVTGFYSYGEISPYATGHCDLHNQTMTLTVFSESSAPISRRDHRQRALPVSRESDAAVRPTIPVPAASNGRRSAPGRASLHEGETPRLPQMAPGQRLAELAQATRRVPTRSVPPVGAGGKVTGLVFDKRRLGDFTIVRFAGRMTEAFKGAALAKELEGKVLFDLAGVERITSFGVREWLQLMQGSQPRVTTLCLARCSEPVINQVGMIRRFSGNGQIVSFYAPYCCDACASQFERLVDCAHDAGSLSEGKPPAATCPRCGGQGSFDDDAQTYFSFVAQHGAAAIPADVRAILMELEEGDDPIGGEAVEKSVDGRVTRVKIGCKLDASVRWSRVADGLEGQVVFDLSGVSGATADGAARFESMLRGLETTVESLRIEGCPRLLAERLGSPSWPSSVRIDSAVVEGRCATCGAIRAVVVDVEKNLDLLRDGNDPRVPCKRCNTLLAFEASRPLLSLLGAHALGPAAPPRLLSPEPPAQTLTLSGKPPSPAQSGAPRGRLDHRGAAAWSRSRAPLVAMGSAVALLAIVGVMWRGGRATGAPAVAAGASAEHRAGAAASVWSELSDLPPAWAERPFVIEGADLFVVGRGGPAATEAQALAEARSDALARLSANMVPELVTSALHDIVVARAPADPNAPRPSELTERIARRLLAQVGSIATPERIDAVVRQTSGHVEAIARYKLSKQSFTAAAASYRQTATFHGITIARFFPELESGGATSGDLVVVNLERNRQSTAGVVPGDVVLSVNDRPVSSVEVFGKVVMDAWARTPAEGTLTLQLESQGARRSVSFSKSKLAEQR